MAYSTYLIHYNKNHSAKNGQFVSGDGDGDGIANDHAHRSNGNKTDSSYNRLKKEHGKKMGIGKGLMIGGASGLLASAVTMAIADATQSEVAAGVSFITGLSGIALETIGSIKYSKSKEAMRKAADKNFKDAIKDNYRAQKYMKERDRYSSEDAYSNGYIYV